MVVPHFFSGTLKGNSRKVIAWDIKREVPANPKSGEIVKPNNVISAADVVLDLFLGSGTTQSLQEAGKEVHWLREREEVLALHLG